MELILFSPFSKIIFGYFHFHLYQQFSSNSQDRFGEISLHFSRVKDLKQIGSRISDHTEDESQHVRPFLTTCKFFP